MTGIWNGSLCDWPGVAGQLCAQGQFKGFAGGVVARFGLHDGRAGLAVPAFELIEIAAIGVGHGGAEVVALHRLAIVAFEIQVHALAEAVAAHQGLVHAHHFGAFFVDRDGIKIVDLDEGVGPHRVRHRARVFGELRLAQGAHLVDAGHGAAGVGADHVGREFLVAEHRQAFFQRQLEPVAAGHAVAGPVVEIFVADHRFDAGVIDIGGDARIGQHIFGIEDVQALVFHRAHVEIADGDDHETVQVQLQAEALFVPADRVFQRLHGVVGFIEVAVFDPHLQQHFAARLQGIALFLADQARGDQREQIGRLLERIFPLGVMATIAQVALFDQVTVRQQHRVLLLVGAQHDGVFRHHVRAVREEGNAAETLGFALGEEVMVRHIQAGQGGIVLRREDGFDIEFDLVGRLRNRQHAGRELVLGGFEQFAVQAYLHQLDMFAVQFDAAAGAVGIVTHADPARHYGAGGIEIETQFHGVDQIAGRRVVLAVNRLRAVCAHRDGVGAEAKAYFTNTSLRRA